VSSLETSEILQDRATSLTEQARAAAVRYRARQTELKTEEKDLAEAVRLAVRLGGVSVLALSRQLPFSRARLHQLLELAEDPARHRARLDRRAALARRASGNGSNGSSGPGGSL
jgi:hypothetical protein